MNNRKVVLDVISIAIIEDVTEIRNNLVEYFSGRPDFLCETAVDSVEAFLRKNTITIPIDILLLDIGLPGISGINGIKLIKSRFPGIEIIILTIYDDNEKIFSALCEGAGGYLLKNTPLPKIEESIKEIHSGGAPMSPQIAKKVLEYFKPHHSVISILTSKEKEVVAGLVEGLSYKMIAGVLDISIETVRQHIKNIYQKLHIHSKGEVITKSIRGEI
jgi:DNA-binding NarL/FixJ family response regulator